MGNTEVAVRGRVVADRYVVGRELGRGGMGVVCEAFDSRLERKVAIKILDPISARKPEAIRRFHREALAAGRIGHENICDVRDRGVTSDGLPFIVMELLVGEPLSRIVERDAPLAPARAVRIMLQVLAALRAAHEAGIIHRDLKPGNVFVTTDGDGNERVKLVDFGISRFQADVSSGEVTVTGTVMGTPRYMSPEQARGKSDVDHRADLWSVGVMLYEALTGERPFAGENYNELMFAIVGEEPEPPSRLLPELAPALEAATLRAMRKDRDARHRDAAELAAELAAALPALSEAPPRMRPRAAAPGVVKRSSPSAATLVGEAPAPPPGGAVDPEGEPSSGGRAPAEVERAAPSATTRRAGAAEAVPDDPDEPGRGPDGPEDGEPERHAVLAERRGTDPPVAARRRPWVVAALLSVLLGLVAGGAAVVMASLDGGTDATAAADLGPRPEGRAAPSVDRTTPPAPEPVDVTPEVVRVPLRGLPAGATATFDGQAVRGSTLEGPAGRTASLEVLARGFEPFGAEVTLAEGLEVDLDGRLRPEKIRSNGSPRGKAGPPAKQGAAVSPGSPPSTDGAFVKGRHGTKITLEYGSE